jgi:hypothetical protein
MIETIKPVIVRHLLFTEYRRLVNLACSRKFIFSTEKYHWPLDSSFGEYFILSLSLIFRKEVGTNEQLNQNQRCVKQI